MKHRYWIFDMDGTLTDSMWIWQQIPLELLRMYGKTARPDLLKRLIPLDTEQTARLMIEEYELPLDVDRFGESSMEAARRLYRRTVLKSGVPEMLERLRREGVQMCICSSTLSYLCDEELERLGIRQYFSFLFTAQGRQSKRYPETFSEVLSRMGGDNPAEAVVCEDSLYAASAAEYAGFTVLGISDAASRTDEGRMRDLCTQFVTDWRELDWTTL